MNKPLAVLLVEDLESDAQLIIRQMQKGSYRVESCRVDEPAQMRAALQRQPWDLVISDYRMPQFDAPSALKILHEMELDIPFIVVSGSIGEEIAVAMMKAGAHDYIMKNNLSRLVPAIERERTQAEERRNRNRAEVALLQAQERLELAVKAGNVGLWDWDMRKNTVYYSPEWKRQIGYEDHEIDGAFQEWVDRIHPEDTSHTVNALNEYVEGQVERYTPEFRIRHRDGTYRWILAQGSLIVDEHGQPVRMVGTHLDITERRRLEGQFIQAQKMESVGRLAGGVAHDFNNLLSVIIGYSDIALDSLTEGDPLHDEIKQIRRAGDSAAALTRQLLAFSRKQVLQPAVFDLRQLVNDAEKMLRRLIGEDVILALVTSDELGRVKADPGQIEQVIMNLVVNARDAMPKGGRLTIEIQNTELDESYVTQHVTVKPGSYVMLSVSDTGEGMDDATIARIFDPFFTTKELGKGTGLGLATVYGIVKQSNGAIYVYSEVGKGTTFKICLPLVEEEIDSHHPPQARTIARGTETILIVEDEDTLRNLTERILAGAGYEVLPVANGGEALLLVERYDKPIHLLLTDVVMPGISGPDLAVRLDKILPGLKVLYMSGYTGDAIVRHSALDATAHFISKPFTATELSRRVRGVIDQPEPVQKFG